jgi:hypothetical protein
VKKKAIYSLMNLVMHCLLQMILTRWRWSNAMMTRSDEKNENLYSTVRYNLTWLKKKLLTFSLSKTKNKKSSSIDVETMIHRLHDMIRLIASSRVLDSKSVESNWNFFEKVLSRIEKLNSSTRVELRSLTRQFDSKTRFDSTRY